MKNSGCLLLFFSTLLWVPKTFGRSSFYPLEIGNRWQYNVLDETLIYEERVLGDTLMPNGFIYRRIYQGGDQSYYFRQQGDRIYQYYDTRDSAHPNHELIRFDFSQRLHDTVDSFEFSAMHIKATITVFDTGFIQIFGQLRPYKTFYWKEAGNTFYHSDRVIDSLGIQRTEIEPGVIYLLQGTVLNGVTYGTVTSVHQDHSPGKATPSFALWQNYPNPFNPSTTIRFSCKERSTGKLAVYDINGRYIQTLVSGVIEAGEHAVIWDGRAGDGSPAASGVYIIGLDVGQFHASRRMTLLR